jgi:anthranilate synthase component 1
MAEKYTLTQVIELAKGHRVVPLIETIFSGSETPISLYEKLTEGRSGSFLLESAEHGVWSRYSFIGVSNRGTLTQSSDGTVTWISADGHGALPADSSQALPNMSLEAVAALHSAWNSSPIAGLPPLTSGLVGALAWDTIREIENLPNRPKDAYRAPNMVFQMFRDLVIVDHQESNLLLVSNLFIESDDESRIVEQYAEADARLGDLRTRLLRPSQPFLANRVDANLDSVLANFSQDSFVDMVNRAKEHVRVGDVFQVVLSQRFDLATAATPLDIYRVLRALNPSPYMYLLNLSDDLGEYAIVGSSPEALVTVNAGRAIMHPIAGSRPRGADWDADAQLETELKGDAKERAEHLMLVDLARNDLLKVCEPTSVTVTEFMQVHKFSHIQHLVSTVEGDVLADRSAVDVFRATFPAGTLSGAPKPRALEIIDDLEKDNRGLYGGVVGYFDFAGNADLAISIRTAILRDGVAHVQAGAGIVLDSNPVAEFEETRSKAAAPLRAVAVASAMEEIRTE